MSNELTAESVDRLADVVEPLVSLRETIGEWQLGSFGLSRRSPAFRVGYGGTLTATSRFRKQQLGPTPKGNAGVALVFRQFDSSPTQATPAEYFVGWVPHDRSEELDRWETFLSGELQKRRDGIHSMQTEATYTRGGTRVELHRDNTVRVVDATGTTREGQAQLPLWSALNIALAGANFPVKPGGREEFTLQVTRNGQPTTISGAITPAYSDVHTLFADIVAQMSTDAPATYVTRDP